MGTIGTARVNAESVLFAFTHGGKPSDAVELRSVDVMPAKPNSGMALHVDGQDDAAWAGIVLKAPHGRWNLADHDGLMLDVRNVGATELPLSVAWKMPMRIHRCTVTQAR